MEILIAGAGRVGYLLARTLCVKHNVTMIDRNAEALERLQENLDILPVQGDIEDPLTYRKLHGGRIDLFIAVADSDEANLVATLIADDVLKIGRKIVRLKNGFFAGSTICRKLGIDATVFPLTLTSETVATLMRYPRANNVKRFAKTAMKLFSVRADSSQGGITIRENDRLKVVAVERDGALRIVSTPEPINPGDLVYVVADGDAMTGVWERLDTRTPPKIGRCAVFGAGELGITIAAKMVEEGLRVKVVDKDPARCREADERLGGRAMVLSSKYGTAELFSEELAGAELAVAATDNDEYNIIKSLEAKSHGIAKVVAINNEPEYYNLMHSLGIVVVRGPKMSAYNAIMERIHSDGIVTERAFCGGKGAMFERRAGDGGRLPRFKGTGRIVAIRKERFIDFPPRELRPDDLLIGFAPAGEAEAMRRWFHGF